MTEIIERISIKRIIEIVAKLNITVTAREIFNENQTRHYLLKFDHRGANCFIYVDGGGPTELVENVIKGFMIEGMFYSSSELFVEDLNDINKQTIIGRLSLQDEDCLKYSVYVNLKGGVTEEHILEEFRLWFKYADKCQDYIRRIEKGTKEMDRDLKKIFGPE